MNAPKWNKDRGEYTYEVADEDLTPREIAAIEEEMEFHQELNSRDWDK